MKQQLQTALANPTWQEHVRASTVYTMDGKPDQWAIVYYPILFDAKTGKEYAEPRALVQNMDKDGFWHKKVPLRYLQKIGS